MIFLYRHTVIGDRWTQNEEDINDQEVFSCLVVRLVSSLCGAGLEGQSRVRAPASRAVGAGPSRPQPPSFFPSPPVTFLPVGESKWSRAEEEGAPGLATDVTLEQGEDGRARHLPLP